MNQEFNSEEEVVEYYESSRRLMNEAHEQLKARLSDIINEYQEYINKGTPEQQAAASVAKGLYGEIETMYGIIHTLTENTLELKESILLQQKKLDAVSTQNNEKFKKR